MGYRVAFQVKPSGAERFGDWTSKNIGNLLAIVLNDVIKSAPSIKDKISDSGEIQGNFSREQADDLGLVLKSGALPAKSVYLEERTVGPSLGADSIRHGITASIVGLALVVLFMLFYYRLSGVNAIIALILNLVILLAGLALFRPHAARIGRHFDDRYGGGFECLIFERIREELRAGKIVMSAVETGSARLW
jgi:preprotein translocase subunit SecD